MDIVLVGIISVILLDIAVLREIVRSKTQEYKVLYTLIILFYQLLEYLYII